MGRWCDIGRYQNWRSHLRESSDKQLTPPTNIVVWGSYDPGKPRVRILLKALELSGAPYVTCHSEIWAGIEDKSQIKGKSKKLLILLKLLLSYPVLITRYLRLPSHSHVVLLYPALIDVIIIWPFARLRGVQIVWDVFISAYDTLIYDRQFFSPQSQMAKIIYLFENFAAHAADIVILDTRVHAEYFRKLYNLPSDRVHHVWVGVEPEHF